MRRIVGGLLLATSLAAWATAPAATPQSAQVALKEPTYTGTGSNLVRFVREATFLLGSKDYYTISCLGGRNTVDREKSYTPGQGGYCVGMPGPVNEGWFYAGFFNVSLNGQEASTAMPSSIEASEQGARAIVDMVWHLHAADLRIRVIGLPGRDYLVWELAVDPRQEIKSFDLAALCYPAFFTGYNQRSEARFLQTPARLVREGESSQEILLVPKDDWWLLFGDELFDVAQTKESAGPCALLVPPETMAVLKVSPLAYGITTTIGVAPGTRRLRLAFWKMKDQTNAAAAEYLRLNAEKIRAELAALDSTPESVRTLDLVGMTTALERIAHAKSGGENSRSQATEFLAWIKDSAADLSAKGDGVNATERKVLLRERYDRFVADARLAELLTSLANNP